MKLRNLILTIALCPLTLFAEAAVENSMGYGSLGLGPCPLPIPNFALGYRMQHNHHGADVSLQVATVVLATELKANALYHYYFAPNLSSQFYVGAGVGFGGLFNRHLNHGRAFISPELVFGKQYLNDSASKRFFQAQISWPTYPLNHRTFYMPLVVFSYGIGF